MSAMGEDTVPEDSAAVAPSFLGALGVHPGMPPAGVG
jgi:hypothetical protein